jgi:phospholipid/cholesterol/gamma-HCH transport system ATP-binding protein
MGHSADTAFIQALGQPPDEQAPMIEYVGVRKAFGDRVIIESLDLKIRRGETMCIIGRSGTGKSVSLKALMGLLRPDAGRILIQGRDVTDLSERDYAQVRRIFGVLFQSGALINWLTVGENVALPLREHTDYDDAEIEKRVREKLHLFELDHAFDLLPTEISGGMKKRAGLARALILDPKILLYDEPTSGLDPVMSRQIDELVRKVQARTGVTSVFVTHDMESVWNTADRLAMLYNGRVIFVGTPDEARATDHPIVQQFIRGDLEGPITADLRREEGLEGDTIAESATASPLPPGPDQVRLGEVTFKVVADPPPPSAPSA